MCVFRDWRSFVDVEVWISLAVTWWRFPHRTTLRVTRSTNFYDEQIRVLILYSELCYIFAALKKNFSIYRKHCSDCSQPAFWNALCPSKDKTLLITKKCLQWLNNSVLRIIKTDFCLCCSTFWSRRPREHLNDESLQWVVPLMNVLLWNSSHFMWGWVFFVVDFLALQ